MLEPKDCLLMEGSLESPNRLDRRERLQAVPPAGFEGRTQPVFYDRLQVLLEVHELEQMMDRLGLRLLLTEFSEVYRGMGRTREVEALDAVVGLAEASLPLATDVAQYDEATCRAMVENLARLRHCLTTPAPVRALSFLA